MPIVFDRIKILCIEHCITVTALERIMGFSQSTIGKWKSAEPLIGKLSKVAKYFNVSMEYLCGLSDVKTKDYELSSICDYTGLDEQTVELLHKMKRTPHWNELISKTSELLKLWSEVHSDGR